MSIVAIRPSAVNELPEAAREAVRDELHDLWRHFREKRDLHRAEYRRSSRSDALMQAGIALGYRLAMQEVRRRMGLPAEPTVYEDIAS